MTSAEQVFEGFSTLITYLSVLQEKPDFDLHQTSTTVAALLKNYFLFLALPYLEEVPEAVVFCFLPNLPAVEDINKDRRGGIGQRGRLTQVQLLTKDSDCFAVRVVPNPFDSGLWELPYLKKLSVFQHLV